MIKFSKCGYVDPECNSDKRKEHRRLRAKNRLPRERPRALTSPLPTPGKPSLLWRATPFMSPAPRQEAFSQSQSPLARLPREIRDIIWTDVLGDRVLHIKHGPAKLLRAIECTKNETGCIVFGEGYWRTSSGTPACLRPLLQTCRMIYSECIPILYGSNVFGSSHINEFLYFIQTVLPQCLNQIRVLHLSWDGYHSFGNRDYAYVLVTWRNACNVLASKFAGLQELRVFLVSLPLMKRFTEPCRLYLEVLTAIKPAKMVEVNVPWSEGECAEDAHVYPFRLMPLSS